MLLPYKEHGFYFPFLSTFANQNTSHIQLGDTRKTTKMEPQIKEHKQEAEDQDQTSTNQEFGKYSNQELNLIDSFNMSSSSKTTLETHKSFESEPRVFSCNYCQRKFYSSQALGGHQNAHKRERTLAKRGQRIGASMMAAAAAFGHGHSYNFSTMASLPLTNSYNRSLGIQAHSMVHKPSFTPSWPKNFYGHEQDWSRPNINQKPSIGKLEMENHHGSFGGIDTARTGIGSLSDNGINRCWRGTSSHMKTTKDEFNKLDLSLKL